MLKLSKAINGSSDVIRKIYPKLASKLSQTDTQKTVKDSSALKESLTTTASAALPFYLDTITGTSVALHEGAHAVTQDLFFQPGNVELQVDGIDNLRNLVSDPSLDNLVNFLTAKDVNEDNAAGYAAYVAEKLTPLGEKIGSNASNAIIAAAGCTSVEAAALLAFALGYKIRHKHPKIGAALMTLAAGWHINNTYYALSALWMDPNEVPGHDWIAFSKYTGIHPAIPAVLMGAALPALAAGLYLMEKRAKEKALNRAIVSRLINKGAIPQEKVKSYWDKFKGKEKVKRLEEELYNHLRSTGALEIDKAGKPILNPSKVDKDAVKILRKLMKEYNAFLDYVAESERDLVNLERETIKSALKPKRGSLLRSLKRAIKESFNLKAAFKRSKLEGVSKTLSIASFGAGISNLILSALGVAVPGLGLVAMSTGLTALALRIAPHIKEKLT